ncbi:MAG: hypothetical protein OEY89_08175 [Gammaproteobacteria bacterium]|nr:hypothetical protein [Gammaproteobacteria bacterium]
MIEQTLTFNKNNLLPELNLQESNIVIASGQESSLIGDNRLWLHGTYQILDDYAQQLAVVPLHKALVITWVSDGSSNTKNLVGDAVLFRDDEELTNARRIGFFNYDLTNWLNMYERRLYYITVSLGCCISNTIQVEVNPV